MPIITLTTDFGYKDAYVAILKAQLYQQLESPEIVDISHKIDPFHIGQAAYVVRSVYRSFPENSIHFIGVDFNHTPEQELLVAQLNNHFFVCADNGFLSLLEPELNPTKSIKLTLAKSSSNEKAVEAIAHLHRGGALSIIGTAVTVLEKRTQHVPVINEQKNEIQGRVLHIDTYGNVITNITENIFDSVRQNRDYVVHARNHTFTKIYNDYHEVIRFNLPKENREEDGKKLALFNKQKHLELAIYKGNPSYGGGASSLFGLSYLDPIRITFINEG